MIALPVRRRVGAVIAVVLSLSMAGCAALTEPVFLERTDIYNKNGIHVWADFYDAMMLGRYWEFEAVNYSDMDVCVRLGLQISGSGGWNIYDSAYIPAGESIVFGQINAPARWHLDGGQVWSTDDGECGF